MEAGKRVLRSRNPLSDCTNIYSLSPAPSRSSSKKCKSAITTPFSNSYRNCGSSDRDVPEPISVVYSRRYTPDKRKNKEKIVAIPFGSTSMAEIFTNGEESNEVEVVDLPEGSTVPYKKQRGMSSEQDLSNHAQLEEFINRQKAYFDEIDEFKLPVEEVDTVEELE